jgi:hypothetical protein
MKRSQAANFALFGEKGSWSWELKLEVVVSCAKQLCADLFPLWSDVCIIIRPRLRLKPVAYLPEIVAAIHFIVSRDLAKS